MQIPGLEDKVLEEQDGEHNQDIIGIDYWIHSWAKELAFSNTKVEYISKYTMLNSDKCLNIKCSWCFWRENSNYTIFTRYSNPYKYILILAQKFKYVIFF